jgi:hypothetical protein
VSQEQEIIKADPTDRIMDTWAITRLIDWAAGKDASGTTKARLRDELRSVAAELAGPSPSPVERMLAETVAVAWFSVRLCEAIHAAGVTSEKGLSLAQSEHSQRRLDRAHRRFLNSVKVLAHIRRLAVPAAVQINLARRQHIELNGGTHEGGR